MIPGAARPTAKEQRARQRENRTCAVLSCGVRLSRYNPGDLCGVHTPKDYRPSRRGDALVERSLSSRAWCRTFRPQASRAALGRMCQVTRTDTEANDPVIVPTASAIEAERRELALDAASTPNNSSL